MNLDFLNLEKGKSANSFNFVNSFMKELGDYLKNIQNKPIIEDGLYQIDRFEGDSTVFAVCQNLETNEMVNIPKSEIPKEASDAYVLKVHNGSCTIDYNETRKYIKNI